MDNKPFSSDEAPADIESLLRSLAPAKCEIPQETIIYRCGYEAGRKSILVPPPSSSSHRRWNDLLLSACLVALMIGPASYWAGRQSQSVRALSGTAVAQNENAPKSPLSASLDNNKVTGTKTTNNANSAANQAADPDEKSTNSIPRAQNTRLGSSLLSERDSLARNFLAEQFAKLTLPNTVSPQITRDNASQATQYLTAHPLRYGADIEEELARLERDNQPRINRTEGTSDDAFDNAEPPMLTPFIKRLSSDEFTEHWEDLIQ